MATANLPETPTETLVAAREMTDAGIRLAMPQLLEQPAPASTDPADELVEHLAAARVSLRNAMKCADRHGDPVAHMALAEHFARFDDFRGVIEGWVA